MTRAEDDVAITQAGGYKPLTGTATDATPTTKGVVKQAAFVADVAALTAEAAVTADADATYGQPEADLINELKVSVNALIDDVTAIRTTLAAVHTALKAAANKPMATS